MWWAAAVTTARSQLRVPTGPGSGPLTAATGSQLRDPLQEQCFCDCDALNLVGVH